MLHITALREKAKIRLEKTLAASYVTYMHRRQECAQHYSSHQHTACKEVLMSDSICTTCPTTCTPPAVTCLPLLLSTLQQWAPHLSHALSLFFSSLFLQCVTQLSCEMQSSCHSSCSLLHTCYTPLTCLVTHLPSLFLHAVGHT
jgi:hypothetical protein